MHLSPALVQDADAALARLDAVLAALAKPLPGHEINRRYLAASDRNLRGVDAALSNMRVGV